MRSLLLRILREPLFTFAIIGGALFLAYAATRPHESEPVILQAQARAGLIASFETLNGRKATADENPVSSMMKPRTLK